MSDNVKAALILAAGLIAAAFIYGYMTPYQTCVRAYNDRGEADVGPIACANILSSG